MSKENGNQSSLLTPTRIGLTFAVLILTIGIATAVYWPKGASSPKSSPGTSGTTGSGSGSTPRELAPETRSGGFKLIGGQSKTLSDYAGKVLVLDIWATWCGPCRQEIPHLIQIANEYRDQGVAVLGLTTEDPEADGEMVRQFTKEFGINYDIGFGEREIMRDVMNGRNGIPQTLIIGRDGLVRKHYVGFHPKFSIPQMKATIDELIALK